MCSVVGYVGNNPCKKNILEGLARLEYRGYDAAGFACLSYKEQKIAWRKTVGGVYSLACSLETFEDDGTLGIGHTRWSTHGISSETNAHPHFDCTQKIALVHNGIIENHGEIRRFLVGEGHLFASDTDTEVIAHLIEKYQAEEGEKIKTRAGLITALKKTVSHLEGSYVCLCLLEDIPDLLLVLRRSTPVALGIGDNEIFVSSDPISFAGSADKVVFLPDESFAFVSKNSLEIYDFAGKQCPVVVEKMQVMWTGMDKKGYSHYMLKEIYEQKETIAATVRSLCQKIETRQVLPSSAMVFTAIHIIACGTSLHAASWGRFFIEHIAHVPVAVYCASEYRYSLLFVDPHALYIFISQSGETADTLEALRVLQNRGARVLVITNSASSTMGRMVEDVWVTQAGIEHAVASTKTFTTQLVALYILAYYYSVQKKDTIQNVYSDVYNDLLLAADNLAFALEKHQKTCDLLAATLKGCEKALFIGRQVGFTLAQEAALKLQEIAYIHAVSCAAGEIKHGPLALVDSHTPIFVFSVDDTTMYHKLVSNVQEVASRKGRLIVYAYEGQDELCSFAEQAFIVPRHTRPLLSAFSFVGVMQNMVYSIARARECSIDRPRNLAKSVTVE